MDTFLPALIEWVKKNDRSMHTIDLKMKYIGDDGVEALAEALRHNTTVTLLDLNRNSIGDRGVRALARVLRTHPTLTKVQLGVNDIGPDGAQSLADAIGDGGGSRLRCLHLVGNQIGNGGAAAFADALRANRTLQELGLEQNDVGNEGAVALGRAIETNDTLCKLELGSNNIGPVGAEALSVGLSTNRSIGVLGLGDNDIRDEGAVSISRALRSNASLTWICLGRNNIGARGAQSLADAIYDDRSPVHVFGSNHTIEHIYGVQSSHEELRSHIRWNKGGEPTGARQRKMAHFMAENPDYPQRSRIDCELLPRLLCKIGKAGSVSTMFRYLIEMPEIFNDCKKADEEAVPCIQPKSFAGGGCRWRRISAGPSTSDEDKIDLDASLPQNMKSKGERMTRSKKSRGRRS